MLHVTVVASDAQHDAQRGEAEGGDSPSSSTSARFRESNDFWDTHGVNSDWGCGVLQVVRAVPTKYGVTAEVGERGVAISPAGFRIRGSEMCTGGCILGFLDNCTPPPPPVPRNRQCLTAEPGVGSCARRFLSTGGGYRCAPFNIP